MYAVIKVQNTLRGWILWLIKDKTSESITMFLHILQRVNSRRQDEEHRRSWARLFKGDGEVQWSANHILAPQFLLYKVSAGGRIWLSSPQHFFIIFDRQAEYVEERESSVAQCIIQTAAYRLNINSSHDCVVSGSFQPLWIKSFSLWKIMIFLLLFQQQVNSFTLNK